MPRQIGWSQESNLLYTIGQQIDRLSQVVAANSGTGGLEEYSSFSAFPPTGTAGIIYLATDTNQIYYWNGFAYVEMSPGVSTNIYNSDGTLTGVRTVNTASSAIAFTATQPAANYAFTIGTPTGVGVGSWPATFVRQGEFNISSASSAEPENSRYWGRNQTTALKSLYVNQSYADVTAETAGGGVSLYNQSFRTYRGSTLDISTAVTTLSNLTGVVNTVGHGYSSASSTTAQIHTQNVNGVQTAIQNNVGNMINVNGYRVILTMSPAITNQNSTITNFYGVNIGTFTIGATSGPTATITNFYALYIDGITTRATGTVTNRWGIYSTDSTMVHYLNGSLRIGTTGASLFKLEVASSDVRFNNVRVGIGAGSVVTNTVVGNFSLDDNSTGYYNTAVGYSSIDANTTGFKNTAVGTYTLNLNSVGGYNTAIGSEALQNTTASNNTAVGAAAARSVTTGTDNVAIGVNALVINSIGNANTAIGLHALFSASGYYNTAIGAYAGAGATTGTGNIFIGYSTAGGITTGSYNTIIGTNISGLTSSLSNNIIIADGQGNIKYRWDGTTNTITGDLNITGVLRETVTANRQTASYQLALTDRGKLVEMNVGSANNLTVPASGTVNFPVGTKIDIAQYGAGQTTVVAAATVTVRSAGGALKLANQYSGATLVKIATDEWYLFGNITT